MTSRRLHLLRHAKSAWDAPGLTDHDRPLAPKGWDACAAMTAHLRTLDVPPELVLCSSALRAQQTLAGIREGLPSDVEVEVDKGLYAAGAPALLERVQQVTDEVASVMLIAHNPGIAALANWLAGHGHDEARRRLGSAYPTGALATYSIDGSWAHLDRGGGVLESFVTPKSLE